jgi:hypothetical protein
MSRSRPIHRALSRLLAAGEAPGLALSRLGGEGAAAAATPGAPPAPWETLEALETLGRGLDALALLSSEPLEPLLRPLVLAALPAARRARGEAQGGGAARRTPESGVPPWPERAAAGRAAPAGRTAVPRAAAPAGWEGRSVRRAEDGAGRGAAVDDYGGGEAAMDALGGRSVAAMEADGGLQAAEGERAGRRGGLLDAPGAARPAGHAGQQTPQRMATRADGPAAPAATSRRRVPARPAARAGSWAYRSAGPVRVRGFRPGGAPMEALGAAEGAPSGAAGRDVPPEGAGAGGAQWSDAAGGAFSGARADGRIAPTAAGGPLALAAAGVQVSPAAARTLARASVGHRVRAAAARTLSRSAALERPLAPPEGRAGGSPEPDLSAAVAGPGGPAGGSGRAAGAGGCDGGAGSSRRAAGAVPPRVAQRVGGAAVEPRANGGAEPPAGFDQDAVLRAGLDQGAELPARLDASAALRARLDRGAALRVRLDRDAEVQARLDQGAGTAGSLLAGVLDRLDRLDPLARPAGEVGRAAAPRRRHAGAGGEATASCERGPEGHSLRPEGAAGSPGAAAAAGAVAAGGLRGLAARSGVRLMLPPDLTPAAREDRRELPATVRDRLAEEDLGHRLASLLRREARREGIDLGLLGADT